jgi:hypothetical protein
MWLSFVIPGPNASFTNGWSRNLSRKESGSSGTPAPATQNLEFNHMFFAFAPSKALNGRANGKRNTC